MISLPRIFFFITIASTTSLSAMKNDNLLKAIQKDDLQALRQLLTDKSYKNKFATDLTFYAKNIVNYGKKNALEMIKLCCSIQGDSKEFISHFHNLECSSLLHDCARHDSLEVAHWLLEQGVPVNALDDQKNTALAYAKSTAFVDLIGDYNGDVNHSKNNLGTPLHHALYQNKKFEVIEALIKHGASVNIRNTFNKTPLFNACDKETATLLIKHGADIFAQDDDGPLLHYYVLGDCCDAAQTLIETGARVNATDNHGNTPLHMVVARAPFKNFLPFIRMLRRYGAHGNTINKKGETASDIFSHIIIKNSCELTYFCDIDLRAFETEFKKIMKENILLKQILHGDVRRITTELDMGSNINISDANKRTPLMYAILKGDPTLVKLLLNHGADTTPIDNENNQAINLALERKNLSIEHKKIYKLIKQKEASNLEISYFKAYRHFNNHAKNATNNISIPNNKTLIRRNSL